MITAIIQARTSSSRLPGKVLLKLNGQTVLEQVVRRVKKSKLIKDVIIATTTDKSDNKIVKLCKNKKIKFFRGDMNNVLDRYYQTAKKFNLKHICRVTSDCPLIDPDVIDLVAKKYLKTRAQYASSSRPKPTYPDGLDTEIFSFKALTRAWQEAQLLSEKEHVTPYIWKNPKKFKSVMVKNKKDLSALRWTLDEKIDFVLIKEIYRKLGKNNKIFLMADILNLLKKRPELSTMNTSIKRNAGYFKSLKEDKRISK
ncbi:MAG: glycosyltransferase family protein [Patescibacteria group bacterium]|jgi:spore coat polysaccharide biosynthesis protein SpsF